MDILVLGVGCKPPQHLSKLSETFSAKVSFSETQLPKEAIDPSTGQWSAENIINSVKKQDFNADKVLCVTDVDIAVRGFNFIFGISEIGGRNCLVSLFRLKPSQIRWDTNKIFEERTLKESVHELGHAFGLEHCADKKCVMSFSNSTVEVDKKGSSFCSGCTKLLSIMGRK